MRKSSWSILPALHKSVGQLFWAALLVAASFAFAQEPKTPADSNAVVSADSLLQQMTATAAQPDSLTQASGLDSSEAKPLQNDAVATQIQPDSVAQPQPDSVAQSQPDTSWHCYTVDLSADEPADTIEPRTDLPKKSVLYLSGGEHSPWFHLGVLYAIENYGVRIDSVVATSWGAFVGYLWTHGMPLDDIQRVLRDPYIRDFVGHNMFDDLYRKQEPSRGWPIAPSGKPGLRYRFAIENDSIQGLHTKAKSFEPDTLGWKYSLAKLRFQEVLNRLPTGAVIPFTVVGCNGEDRKTAADVFKSLPLSENTESGELCPGLALPAEDVYEQVPIISVGVPRVALASVGSWHSPWQRILLEKPLQDLENQAGIVVRAHYATDSAYTAWIQLGFSATERHLTEMLPFRKDSLDYLTLKKASKPWFRFKPSFDSLSAELHSTIKSYWNEGDTGMVAPENFLKELSQESAYDSVTFDMQPSGDLLVAANVRPTVDATLGGFGSNAIGPHIYGNLELSSVNQMDILLGVSGFWGGRSYGVSPKLELSRLWSRDWGFGVRYDWMTLKPLESYLSDHTYRSTVRGEERSDFYMWVDYRLSRTQKVSLDFMLGKRTIEFARTQRMEDIDTWPVAPSLSYRLESGDVDPFFALQGYSLFLKWGLQSVRYKIGIADLIPIHHQLSAEIRGNYPLTRFMTVGAAAVGGLDMYHDEGNGYVYPKSTGLLPMDNYYRRPIAATPWNTEWYNPELLSHHYGLLRLNVALHKGALGMWVFGAYVRDFEENPTARLNPDKFVLEPALRFAYKSITAYVGMSRLVDSETLDELGDVMDYTFFVRIGNYCLF
jgi:NTE family protein